VNALTDEEWCAAAQHLWGPHWRAKCAIRLGLFDRQLELYDAPERRRAAHPGRRAGKSTGLPAFALMDALDCKPTQPGQFAEVVVMGGETAKKAESMYWAPIHALIQAHRLPFAFNGKLGAFLHERRDGSGIYLWGIADKGAADMLRGYKVRAAYFDEVMTYQQHLDYLAESALGPALGDLGGALTFAGTPSVTRAGPWFQLCHSQKWRTFHWDVRQNPKFPRDPMTVLNEEAERYGGWDNATFRREWLGEFVDDASMMVVEFDRARNTRESVPAGYSLAWPHVVGVDYGYNDAFAIVVLTMRPEAPAARYVVHAEKLAQADYDQCAAALKRVAQRFQPRSVVCDPAGGGKPFYETWNNRYGAELGLAVRSAHKVAGSLVESIRFQNTELRMGRLQAIVPDAEPLVSEWAVLPWKDTWKDAPSDDYAQDAFDACRYALMETIAWAPREVPTAESEDAKLQREVLAQIEAKQRARESLRTRGRW